MKIISKALAAIPALAFATAVGLVSAGPASADSGVEVDVANGKLTITGTANADDIQINQITTGSYAVWITPTSGPVEVHNVSGVTGDVVLDTGDGDDRVRIGSAAPISLPDSLVVRPATGYNSIDVTDTTIADDLVAAGKASVSLRNSEIGDDLIASSEAAGLSVHLIDSAVLDFANLRSTRGGVIWFDMDRSSVRRVRMTGNKANDRFKSTSSDLGFNPRFDLGSGNDHFTLVADSEWSGTLSFNAGNGKDTFETFDEETYGVPISAIRMGKISAQLGNDDDFVYIYAPIMTAGSVVNGQGGFDHLSGEGYDDPASQADYRLFEDIETPPEERLDIDTTNGDLTITVNDLIGGLYLDSVGDDYRVVYRNVSSPEYLEEIVTGIDGDVAIKLRANLLLVNVGSNNPTSFPGKLTLSNENDAHARFDLTDVSVAGDLNVLNSDSPALRLLVDNSTVGGRFDARATGRGELGISADGSSFGRFRVNGANYRDSVILDDSDLGVAPFLSLRSGDDFVLLSNVGWTGRLQLNAGSGNDEFGSSGELPLGRARLLMGAGDDQVDIHGMADDGAGSQVQGDAGSDVLTYITEFPRAVVRTFETINQTP